MSYPVKLGRSETFQNREGYIQTMFNQNSIPSPASPIFSSTISGALTGTVNMYCDRIGKDFVIISYNLISGTTTSNDAISLTLPSWFKKGTTNLIFNNYNYPVNVLVGGSAVPATVEASGSTPDPALVFSLVGTAFPNATAVSIPQGSITILLQDF